MDVLYPEKLEHKNPCFGKREVKSFCETFRLNKHGTHLAYIKFKTSGRRSIPDQLNKLLVAVDTFLPSNPDCEQGFSTMNNIITDIRNMILTSFAKKYLFISTVGSPSEK